MLSLVVTALSQAALAVISRLIAGPLLEKLIAKLVVQAADVIAKKTGTSRDDELVALIRAHLEIRE